MAFSLQRISSSQNNPCTSDFSKTFRMLCSGMKYVHTYFNDLKMGLTKPHHISQPSYIEHTLVPSASNAKRIFDDMMDSSAEHLGKINNALEKSVADKKKINDDMKKIEAEEAKISVELYRQKTAVDNAKKTLDQKNAQLSKATVTLRSAEVKLQEACKSQDTAEKVGIGLFFIPLIGLVAGPITLAIANTILEDAIIETRHHKNAAENECASSKRDLETATSLEKSLKEKFDQLHSLKINTNQKLAGLKKSINQLRKDQAKINDVNEKIKRCHKTLCSFHGTLNILWGETTGGYSLSLLLNATHPVIESVRSLVQCSSVIALCDNDTLTDLNFHYKQIEQYTCTAIGNESNDDDLLYLI